jgi:hypothetical protein
MRCKGTPKGLFFSLKIFLMTVEEAATGWEACRQAGLPAD